MGILSWIILGLVGSVPFWGWALRAALALAV